MPEMFPESASFKGLRRCVFSKQTSIIYRIKEEYLEVVRFLDNRVGTFPDI
jgi:mRNA-degrading endonuclease YafQ of YafQ-DinJ toxin-antitoxin module